ncbi:MAG: TonB C-terminal domain-containing protein [Sandaracinus sp.]|nr:TonB C-terminal domain-containing protein [Sandaracinus sp.]MCB9621818.1 TonB C-terminal domain-containing protein [Sandaracinus sp.]
MKRDPALLAFVVALGASLLVHGPVYAVLGVFADEWLADRSTPAPPPPSPAAEPEWMELVPDEPEPEASTSTEPTERTTPSEEPTPEEVPLPARPRPERAPEPPAPPPEPQTPRVQTPPTPPPENLHAIEQRSDDPNVEPPPETQFVARENRRVEEETVAREADVQGNQDESANEVPDTPDPEDVTNEGNSVDDIVADRRANGSSEGPAEETHDDSPGATEERGSRVAARGDGREVAPGRDTRDEREGAASEAPRRAARTETVVIDDGLGTLVIRRPVGTGGDAASEREGRETQARGDSGDANGARARRRAGLGRGRRADGPNLRLSWSDFESVMGEEQLREEREAALAARQNRQRGRHAERTRRWREFRQAIENFVSNVRPGNQTALNARAHPFAAYIAELHRRLHVHYHSFVDAIPADPTHPFNQGELATTLEIVLRPDGEVDHVGVVRTSGLTLFDFSAWKAVMDAKPYPAAPENIRSVDGNVYVHYTFYRDTRFCHPSNAAPFILSEVPTRRGSGTGVGPGTEVAVPQGAQPWGRAVEN